MSKYWDYFKNYKIKPTNKENRRMIKFMDGGHFGLTDEISSQLYTILEHCGVLIPVYDKFDPPMNNKLKLITPFVIRTCAMDGIKLLEKHTNPQVKLFSNIDKTEPLFEPETYSNDEDLRILNTTIKFFLKRIAEISEQGYFIIMERN